MSDIVERLRDEAQRPAIREVCSEADDEIARLQGLIKNYAKARKGITLNWTVDRFGNWSAFHDADRAIQEEALILAWLETPRKQAPHG